MVCASGHGTTEVWQDEYREDAGFAFSGGNSIEQQSNEETGMSAKIGIGTESGKGIDRALVVCLASIGYDECIIT